MCNLLCGLQIEGVRSLLALLVTFLEPGLPHVSHICRFVFTYLLLFVYGSLSSPGMEEASKYWGVQPACGAVLHMRAKRASCTLY